MYIDGVLSRNNQNIANWISLIFSKEFEKKETTKTASSASFLTYTSNLTAMVNFLP